MSGKLRLNGATSGYSELQAPDVAGDQTFTLPTVGGTLSTVGYQQGEWDISLVDSTNNYTSYQPVWSRIGQAVTVNGRFGFSDSSKASAIRIVGMPYPIDEIGHGVITGSAMCEEKPGAGAITTYVASDQSIRVYLNTSTGNFTALKYSNFNDNAIIVFSITYYTDDTTWVPINGATIS